MKLSYSRLPSLQGHPKKIKQPIALSVYMLKKQNDTSHSIAYCTNSALENALGPKKIYNFQTYPASKWRGLAMFRMGNPKLGSDYKNKIYNILSNWLELGEKEKTSWIIAFNKLGMFHLVRELKNKTKIKSKEMDSAFKLSSNKLNDYNMSDIWNAATDFESDANSQVANIISLIVLSTKGKFKGLFKINEINDITKKFIKQRLHLVTGDYELSWFYRAVAMLPIENSDFEEMKWYMDLAEYHANKIDDKILYLENIFPLLQSRSKEALIIGDIELAINRMHQLISISPSDSLPYLQLADIYRNYGDLNSAIVFYRKSAEQSPPWDVPSMISLAEIYYKKGEISQTINILFEIVQHDPWCYPALKQLNFLISKMDREKKALLSEINLTIKREEVKFRIDPIEDELIRFIKNIENEKLVERFKYLWRQDE